AFEQHGARTGPGERDAQIGQYAALAAERHRHPRNWIFDRATDADLIVGRAQAGRIARAYRRDELAVSQRQVVLAVALALGDWSILSRVTDIELLERNGARSAGSREIDCGVERQQSRREIAAEGRKANAPAFRCHVADVAGRLEAMIVGGAPPFALVIVEAARVEADIAADRPHVAMSWPGDAAGGLRYYRVVPQHVFVRGELGELDRGPDLEGPRVGPDRAQLLDLVDVDEHRWRDDATPDIDHQVGAAAEEPAIGMARARLDHLVERGRPHKRKLRQGVHRASVFAFAASRLRARRRLSSAANTRSGVTGSVLKRTPMASAMALVSAGRKAASEPSPASLAPNGPCGSLLSMIPTSIGGESWMVGTRGSSILPGPSEPRG